MKKILSIIYILTTFVFNSYAIQLQNKINDNAIQQNFEDVETELIRLDKKTNNNKNDIKKVENKTKQVRAYEVENDQHGNLQSIDVQSSLEELDTEKFHRAGSNVSNNDIYGNVIVSTGNLYLNNPNSGNIISTGTGNNYFGGLMEFDNRVSTFATIFDGTNINSWKGWLKTSPDSNHSVLELKRPQASFINTIVYLSTDTHTHLTPIDGFLIDAPWKSDWINTSPAGPQPPSNMYDGNPNTYFALTGGGDFWGGQPYGVAVMLSSSVVLVTGLEITWCASGATNSIFHYSQSSSTDPLIAYNSSTTKSSWNVTLDGTDTPQTFNLTTNANTCFYATWLFYTTTFQSKGGIRVQDILPFYYPHRIDTSILEYSTNTYISKHIAEGVPTTNTCIFDSSGKVGIGTTAPDNKLNVIGNTSMSGVFYSSGTGNNYIAGKLGIGFSNPDNALNISGNISNTGFIRSSGTANSYIGGNLGIANTNPTQKLDVTGNANVSGQIYGSSITVTVNPFRIANSTCDYTFDSDKLDGQQKAYYAVYQDVQLSTAGLRTDLTTEITNRQTGGNNLGYSTGTILNTVNAHTTSINNLGYSTGTIKATQDLILISTGNLLSSIALKAPINNASLTGTLTVGSTYFYINSAGLIGMGTTAPGSNLHILGGGATYLLIGSLGANTLDRGIGFYNQAGANAGIISLVPNTIGTDSAMVFYVGGGAAGDVKMVINDSGFVGINEILTPTHSLQVSGQGHFTSSITATNITTAENNIAQLKIDTATIVTSVALKAPIATPTFTGEVTTNSDFKILKNGSDSVAEGGYFQIFNGAGNAGFLIQNNSGNGLDFWALKQPDGWNEAFDFDWAGTGRADTEWITYSPNIRDDILYKNKEILTGKDYLEWALQDANKPIKPYKGIPSLRKSTDTVKTASQFDTMAEVEIENKKYSKGLAKISIGVAHWAEEAEQRIKILEDKIKALEIK